MKMNRIIVLALALAAGGCVTGTRAIDLSLPDQTDASKNGRTVHISEILDSRAFEQKPAQASTPSVNGNLADVTPGERAKLIGRQRNGYGKAMGDVALANDSTVQNELRRLLEAGFSARGYQITGPDNADVTVSANIQRFWGWFRPGFVQIGFETDIESELTVESSAGSTQIKALGHGINKGQVASDENWQLSFLRAYTDFLEKLDIALKEAGL